VGPGAQGGGGVLTGAGGGPGGGGAGAAVQAGGAGGAGGQGGEGAGWLGPPYPVVLCHGFFGFEEFAGLDFVTYYFGVKEDLAMQGELVFTPAVDPFNDSTFRGAQLTQRVEEIRQATGREKVILVGHSQGGLDARVVAHDRPDLVAAVVTLATPHQGTEVADVALGLLDNDDFADLVDDLVKLIGGPLYDQVGDYTSLVAPLELFSKEGIAAFNAAYPDAPGVDYYSITGRTDHHTGGTVCAAPGQPEFVSEWNDETDTVDPLFAVSEAIIDGGLFAEEPNDGLVRVDGAKWGTFLGCIPADHMDEVGHLLGDSPGGGNSFDHKRFYRGLVTWLRSQGY
jgi:triacylglycerol lipase